MPRLLESITPAEKPLFIKAIQDGPTIRLTIVDENGKVLERGNILSIESDGKLTLYQNIAPASARRAGIKLDSSYRIQYTIAT